MADLQLFFYEEVHQEQKELIFDEDFNKGGIDPHYTPIILILWTHLLQQN